MIGVVTWLWDAPGNLFGPEYVNRLACGLRKHLRAPHTFTVITDHERDEFDGDVRVHPMVYDHAEMRAGNRSCFRRLALHGPLGLEFGSRLLQLDLDTVIVDDVTPLFDRDEPIVMVTQNKSRTGSDRRIMNPSATLFTPLVWRAMWDEFHAAPAETWQAAKREGWSCSDMSVLNRFNSHLPVSDPRRAATWSDGSGMLSYWKDCHAGALPPGARMVHFYGMFSPGDHSIQKKSPWIAEHWGGPLP